MSAYYFSHEIDMNAILNDGTLTISGKMSENGYEICKHVDNIEAVKVIRFRDIDTSDATSFRGMFANLVNLEAIHGLELFNTERVYDMRHMFENCESLKEIDGVNRWNMSCVFYADSMFENCKSLRFVNINAWEFHGSSCDCMFKGCVNVKYIDMKNTVIYYCTYDGMFENCTNLICVRIGAFYDHNPDGIPIDGCPDYIFKGCPNIITHDMHLETMGGGRVNEITIRFMNIAFETLMQNKCSSQSCCSCFYWL